jgi:lipopolysaccharide export system protein LptA
MTGRRRANMKPGATPASVAPAIRALAIAIPLAMSLAAPLALAQGIDMTHGGPIQVTAQDGMEWRQGEHVVIAKGDAKAVRGNVTVTADRLYAWYRRKGGDSAAPEQVSTGTAGTEDDTEGNEVYRLRAEGNVHIYTATDQAWGDQGTYDLDQAVMVLTGHALKLTTTNDVLTCRDTLEYWSQKHMAVARGDAVVVTNDGRRISADTLVAYMVDTPANAPATGRTQVGSGAPGSGAPGSAAPGSASPGPTGTAPAQAAKTPQTSNATAQGGQPAQPAEDSTAAMVGKVQRVEAFNNVTVRTATDIVTGDRGVYVPDTDIAHLGGHVRITRGENQINGSEAVVNQKTGVATLISGDSGRVTGLMVPNDQSNPSAATDAEHKPPQAQSKPEGKP